MSAEVARKVILVRHAEPDVRPDRDPRDWTLSAEGRSAAGTLRRRLPAVATFASSDEAKAVATLSVATDADFTVDSRFGEVRRPPERVQPGFRAIRSDWVAGHVDERHDGWERPEEAAARFAEGIASLPGDVLVVATHGMILTAWLSSIGELAVGEAAATFWAALALPDVVEVELS